MTGEIALPGLENGPETTAFGGFYGAGITESETRAAITELEEENGPLTGAKRITKQLALSLAASIDKGNLKGRAIANEAGQLFLMMQQLAPAEAEEADDSGFSPQMKRLLNALEAPAQFDTAPEGDAA